MTPDRQPQDLAAEDRRAVARAGAVAATRAVCETLALLGVDAEVVRHIAEHGEAVADGIADDVARALATGPV